MNVETTLETDARFAETGKPGMRALNHPAMPPKLLLAFYAAAASRGGDPSFGPGLSIHVHCLREALPRG